MANLIQAAQDLEYINKDKLIEMAQGGESRYPPYLILAEIQRRTQLEKSYNAMQPQPTTTVAEEKVAEFAQAGLGGMDSLNTLPPEENPMSPPPMQMAASGGLTGYANKGRTTYQDTFSYSPSIEGNLPFSQEGLINLLKERGINNEEEQARIFSLLSNAGNDTLSGRNFGPSTGIKLADVFRDSEDFIAQPYRGIDSFYGRMTDRRGFADKILKGVQPGLPPSEGETPPISEDNTPPISEDNTPPLDAADDPFKIQKNPPPPVLDSSTVPTTDIFATVDQIKKRLGDVEYNTPTAEELRKNRVNETLMGIGALIASSTDRKDFGEGLSELTANAIASKRLDDRSMTDTAFKKRGVDVQNIQLAATLEGLKSKAVAANNTLMANKIDAAQILVMQMQQATPDERKRLQNEISSLLAPYLSNNASAVSSQSDVSSMVKNATP